MDIENLAAPTPVDEKSEELMSKLPPAKQAQLSTILNGVGNGLLVGTLPIVAYEGYQRFKNPATPRSLVIPALCFATVSAVVGCMYGFKEAKQVENYRQSLGDEIELLHKDNVGTKAKIEELTRRLEAKENGRAA
jgi:hypothetical protein